MSGGLLAGVVGVGHDGHAEDHVWLVAVKSSWRFLCCIMKSGLRRMRKDIFYLLIEWRASSKIENKDTSF